MISAATRLCALVFGSLILTNLLLLGGGPVMNAESVADDVTQARVGQEFAIKIGQQMKIEGEDLQVKFAAVSEDSRCPENVNCIWAGNAEVALDLIQGQCTTLLKLNTHQNSPGTEEGKSGRYRVKLVKLDPYPRSDRKIASGDYTATLLISRE